MPPAPLTLQPVRTPGEHDRFIRVPMRLNARDPAWIDPLISDRQAAFSAKGNPFFAHAEVEMWLAVRGGADVGRISAQIDRLAPADPERPAGHFGLIAAEDDPEVFAALLAAAEAWLAARGVKIARGPFNLSINEEVGLLIDGFETPPMLMMGHDPAYAAARVEAQGYAKAKDVYAYGGPVDDYRSQAMLERALRNPAPGVTFRMLDMARYEAEVDTLTDILNDAWRDNWGFTPTTEEETRHLAKAMRPIVDRRLIWFAEIDGETAGVLVVLPNINEAIEGLGGKLLPFGWAKLLWRLKVRGLKSVRVPLMGVRRAHARTVRGRMLPFQLIAAAAAEARKLGYERYEFSWILEDNHAMRRICDALGAGPYKTYRIYEKALG
jgi:GNAT superfamily N-acetyltransferase